MEKKDLEEVFAILKECLGFSSKLGSYLGIDHFMGCMYIWWRRWAQHPHPFVLDIMIIREFHE